MSYHKFSRCELRYCCFPICSHHQFCQTRPSADLSTEGLDTLVDGDLVLRAGLAGLATEDELGVELPVRGDLPLSGNLLVDQGVVVLEVGADGALGLERGPDDELEHGVRLRRPAGELVGVHGEVGLLLLDGLLILEEENLLKDECQQYCQKKECGGIVIGVGGQSRMEG